jgi:MFS family permease
MALGAIVPVFSLYLKSHLNFTGAQIGIIFSSSALGVFISPLFTAFIIDRFIKLNNLFRLLHLFGAVSLLFLYFQRSFFPVLFFFFLFMLFSKPLENMMNTITFRSLAGKRENFGFIRLWGTAGWMAAGWIYGLIVIFNRKFYDVDNAFNIMLLLAALYEIIIIIASRKLPEPDMELVENKMTPRSLMPSAAFQVIFKKEVIIISVTAFLFISSLRFFLLGNAPYLEHIGIPGEWIMPVMTLTQVFELITMLYYRKLILKIDARKLLLSGMILYIMVFLLFALSTNPLFILLGYIMAGPAFALFFNTVIISLDSYCDDSNRAGVHQLFSFFAFGLSTLLANLYAGELLGTVSFRSYWMIPSLIASIGAVAFALVKFRKIH